MRHASFRSSAQAPFEGGFFQTFWKGAAAAIGVVRREQMGQILVMKGR